MKKTLRLALALATISALSAAAAAPTFVGTWIGKTDVPDVGPDQVTLIVKKAGTDYAATLSDSAAVIAENTAARDVKVDGQTISFWFPLASGETVSVQLTITGDTMNGGWTHESGQTGSLTFERQK